MALEKIHNPMRDDMYYSRKTGKYKVDLSRFGVKKKAEERHVSPSMKSARRHALKNKMSMAPVEAYGPDKKQIKR